MEKKDKDEGKGTEEKGKGKDNRAKVDKPCHDWLVGKCARGDIYISRHDEKNGAYATEQQPPQYDESIEELLDAATTDADIDATYSDVNTHSHTTQTHTRAHMHMYIPHHCIF